MKAISLNWLLAALAVIGLAACTENRETAASAPPPVHFESGDECHLCGMIITRFPGPKGEAITGQKEQVLKFCSTRDMFAWALQPENAGRNHTLYVHDMAQTHWERPDDTALINAREAYYVVGSGRHGAMGPTLASFAGEADARAFMQAYGGELLRFSDITLAHLAADDAGHGAAGMSMPGAHHEHSAPAQHEHAGAGHEHHQ